MDNSTRWNITNSAQNIVSALVDPSKQYDHVFRRDWNHTFSSFSRPRPTMRGKQDSDIKAKLANYVVRLEEREQIKKIEAKTEAQLRENEDNYREKQDKIDVPEIFMSEDFDLSNLDTFTKVVSTVNSGYVQKHVRPEEDDDYFGRLLTKGQLKDLQQKLTDYLDIIEERLASQISNRSGDFFQVMSSVDSVMDELSLAIKSVTSLRSKCSKLNETLIMPNMKNIQLSKSRNNAQTVLDTLKGIAEMCKVPPMIQLLLSTSDYNGALELIAKSRAKLRKELPRVSCLKHLESELVEIEREIGAMMHQEFVALEKFVIKFHEERKKRIESILDIEQWKMVESVPHDFQRLVSMLVDENLNISDTYTLDSQYHSQSGQSSREHSRAPSDAISNIELENLNKYQSNGSGNTNPETVSSLHVTTNQLKPSQVRKLNYVSAGGSTYVIVNSVINLARIVIDYCKCAQEIKPLSDEILEHLFKILQLYNSKTYHLVYSAGAIQVAGLKTITTRSLVVSQRSLKLIILLIPAIHRHFSQLLPDYNRLRRFDEIKLSYEDHAAKIPERVNSIVRDVISLQLQEWEARPPVPSPQFSAVAQHLMRLHDNIQDVLPPDELRLLFLKINNTFKDVLMTHLCRLNINNDAGPQRWLVTQELTFYKINLSKLNVFKGWELNYDDLWTKLNSESDSNNSMQPQQQSQ